MRKDARQIFKAEVIETAPNEADINIIMHCSAEFAEYAITEAILKLNDAVNKSGMGKVNNAAWVSISEYVNEKLLAKAEDK